MQKLRPPVVFSVLWLSLWMVSSPAVSAEIWPQGLERLRQKAAAPLRLAGQRRADADIVLLDRNELLQSAAQWIVDFTQRTAGASLPVGGREQLHPGRGHVVAMVGDADPLARRLAAAGLLHLDPRVGPQGFVIERLRDPQSGEPAGVLVAGAAGVPLRADRDPAIVKRRGPIGRHRVGPRGRAAPVSHADLLRQLCRAPAKCLQSQPAVRCSGEPLDAGRLGTLHRHDFRLPLQPVRVLARADAVFARGAGRRQDATGVRRDDQSRDRLRQAPRRGRASHCGQHGGPELASSLPQRSPGADRAVRPVGLLVAGHARQRIHGHFSRRSGRVLPQRLHGRDFRRPVPRTEQGRAEEQSGREDRSGHLGRALRRLGRAPVDRRPPAGRKIDALLPVEAARVPARHVCQHQPGFQPRLQPGVARRRRPAVRPGGRQNPPRAHLGLQRYRGRGHRLAALPGARACSSSAARNGSKAATRAESAIPWPRSSTA